MARQQTDGFPGVHKGQDSVQRKYLPKKKGPSSGIGCSPGANLNLKKYPKKSGKP